MGRKRGEREQNRAVCYRSREFEVSKGHGVLVVERGIGDVEGVLGLAEQTQEGGVGSDVQGEERETLERVKKESFVARLKKNGLIDRKEFTLILGQNIRKIVFGSFHFSSNFPQLKVSPRIRTPLMPTPKPTFKLASIRLGSSEIFSSSLPALLDTGSSPLIFPSFLLTSCLGAFSTETGLTCRSEASFPRGFSLLKCKGDLQSVDLKKRLALQVTAQDNQKELFSLSLEDLLRRESCVSVPLSLQQAYRGESKKLSECPLKIEFQAFLNRMTVSGAFLKSKVWRVVKKEGNSPGFMEVSQIIKE